MGKKIIAFLVFCFFLCNYLVSREPKHIRMADSVTREYLKEVNGKYSLSISGTGGAMMDNIKTFDVTFSSRELMEVDDAQRLLVNLCELYLAKINANDEIRPYLNNYPSTYENLRIAVLFEDEHGYAPRNKLAAITLSRGIVFYSVFNQEKEVNKYVFNESYEKVVKKIIEGKQFPSEGDEPLMDALKVANK